MEQHALADERLHAYAMARLDIDWQARRPGVQLGVASPSLHAPAPTDHAVADAPVADRPAACGLVLFLHLEKTGGSTLVNMFEELEKRNELLFFKQTCGWPQFASQLMERFRSELGLPYGSYERRRLDRLMHPDAELALHPVKDVRQRATHAVAGPHFKPVLVDARLAFP